MKIVHEKADGCLFIDVLISPQELLDIDKCIMREGESYLNGMRLIIGVRKTGQEIKPHKEIDWRRI